MTPSHTDLQLSSSKLTGFYKGEHLLIKYNSGEANVS